MHTEGDNCNVQVRARVTDQVRQRKAVVEGEERNVASQKGLFKSTLKSCNTTHHGAPTAESGRAAHPQQPACGGGRRSRYRHRGLRQQAAARRGGPPVVGARDAQRHCGHVGGLEGSHHKGRADVFGAQRRQQAAKAAVGDAVARKQGIVAANAVLHEEGAEELGLVARAALRGRQQLRQPRPRRRILLPAAVTHGEEAGGRQLQAWQVRGQQQARAG